MHMVATQVAELFSVSPVYIKRIIKEREIPFIKEGSSEEGRILIPPESVRKIYSMRGLEFKKKIVTIGIEKGGVGKSLLTVNVAAMLAQRGVNVLVIDLDPEACATSLFYTESVTNLPTIYEILKGDVLIKDAILQTRYGVDLIPCKGSSRRVERLAQDQNPKRFLADMLKDLNYDIIMFDIPPQFTRLLASAYLASDLVIMPTFPDAWSIESIDLTIEDIIYECKKFECRVPELKILMNKYNVTRVATRDAWDSIVASHPEKVLSLHIRESAALQNMANSGRTVVDPGVAKDIRAQFSDLCGFICPPIKLEESASSMLLS